MCVGTTPINPQGGVLSASSLRLLLGCGATMPTIRGGNQTPGRGWYMSVLDQSIIIDRYVYLQVMTSGWCKPEPPYYWTNLSTVAQRWSLVGRNKWRRTYCVHRTPLAQQPHGGILSPCSSNLFLISVLKVPPPITGTNRGVLTTRTSGYY